MTLKTRIDAYLSTLSAAKEEGYSQKTLVLTGADSDPDFAATLAYHIRSKGWTVSKNETVAAHTSVVREHTEKHTVIIATFMS